MYNTTATVVAMDVAEGTALVLAARRGQVVAVTGATGPAVEMEEVVLLLLLAELRMGRRAMVLGRGLRCWALWGWGW